MSCDQDQWTLDHLAQKLGGIDRALVKKGLNTWMDHGVVKAEADDTYVLLEKADESAQPRRTVVQSGKISLGNFVLRLDFLLSARAGILRYVRTAARGRADASSLEGIIVPSSQIFVC